MELNKIITFAQLINILKTNNKQQWNYTQTNTMS